MQVSGDIRFELSGLPLGNAQCETTSVLLLGAREHNDDARLYVQARVAFLCAARSGATEAS